MTPSIRSTLKGFERRSEVRPRRWILRPLVCALLVVLCAAQASATTVMYASVDELVNKADGVVVATVRGKDSRYGADGEIYTYVTLSDLDFINGTYERPELTLRFQGGEVKGDVLEIVGSPEFAEGDRVILFIKGNGESITPIVGWTQGVLRVKPNSEGVEEVFDHDGNRVLGVDGPHLAKEAVHPSELHVQGDRNVRGQSRNAKAVVGENDDGSPAGPEKSAQAERPNRAMPAAKLISMLRKKAAAASSLSGHPQAVRSAEDFSEGETSHRAMAPADRGLSAQPGPTAAPATPVLPEPFPSRGGSRRPSGN